VKTLAIKLDDEAHARLSFLAHVQGTSLTDVLRQAVEALLEQGSANPQLAAKARDALEQLDRETAERRKALEALVKPPSKEGNARGRKSS
jgi:predicted transcriptional regulator